MKQLLLLTLLVLGAGCRSNPEDAEILPRDTLPLSFNRGTVVGRVLDDRTSRPLPKARLQGTWTVLLRFERRGALGPAPSQRAVSGTISFADTFPPVWPGGTPADSFVTNEVGHYDIDLTPFFGTQIAQDASYTTFGSTGGSFAIEATGSVFSYDSVTIDLIPRISHGGLSFSGRMVADSVVGQWVQRAYCCGARGTFIMHRPR